MKKPKTMTLNLADMTEEKLIKLIGDNNLQAAELFAILESLFEMFSCSLRFSSTVMQYGHEHHVDFVPTFLRHAAKNHGIDPQKMIDLIVQNNPSPSSSVH